MASTTLPSLKSPLFSSLQVSVHSLNNLVQTKTCKIAFAKHKFPLFTNPLGTNPAVTAIAVGEVDFDIFLLEEVGPVEYGIGSDAEEED